MDAVNELALKSAGERKEGIFAKYFFFQATSEMQQEAAFYLLMLGEKKKSAKWQTDNIYFWHSFAPFESVFPSKIQIHTYNCSGYYMNTNSR